jgi:hypothetical protein
VVISDAPQLVAHFATDAQGEPQYVATGAGLKHYKIVIEVENPPSDLLAATFYLDPSYYLPVRTVEPGADGKVTLETTAYGDYPLKVDLHRGATREPEPRIGAAIAEIAAH